MASSKETPTGSPMETTPPASPTSTTSTTATSSTITSSILAEAAPPLTTEAAPEIESTPGAGSHNKNNNIINNKNKSEGGEAGHSSTSSTVNERTKRSESSDATESTSTAAATSTVRKPAKEEQKQNDEAGTGEAIAGKIEDAFDDEDAASSRSRTTSARDEISLGESPLESSISSDQVNPDNQNNNDKDIMTVSGGMAAKGHHPKKATARSRMATSGSRGSRSSTEDVVEAMVIDDNLSGNEKDEDGKMSNSNGNTNIDDDNANDSDTPMNLTNVATKANPPGATPILTPAKMRLKKQRLEAAAAAAAAANSKPEVQQQVLMTSLPAPTSSWNSSFEDSPTSALHRLAEVAERKHEEEMMEIESAAAAAPRIGAGTPSSASVSPPRALSSTSITSTPTPPPPTGRPLFKAAHLVPHAEFEMTSSPVNSMNTNGNGGPRIAALGSGFPPTPSPDSAIHSGGFYSSSPSQSPVQARHLTGVSSPASISLRGTPNSLSRTSSDGSASSLSASNSPTLLGPRGHPLPLTVTALPSSPLPRTTGAASGSTPITPLTLFRHIPTPGGGDSPTTRRSPPSMTTNEIEDVAGQAGQPGAGGLSGGAGISRQQLINSPCPVCGDKISGFHYGIFSCESCKGFFKRTVQNKKNYQCLRGANCPVSIATRKKCPACRFNKCLNTGMKLEAIREDRTRGGRSTYQCSYTLPAGIVPPAPPAGAAQVVPSQGPPTGLTPANISNGNSTMVITTTSATNEGPSSLPPGLPSIPLPIRSEEARPRSSSGSTVISLPSSSSTPEAANSLSASAINLSTASKTSPSPPKDVKNVPQLIQEIMDVEHLWFSKPNEHVSNRLNGNENSSGDMVQTLTNMADRRLFKLVKWCKSLPLFKNILIDDQIALLINAWCELLVFSCCFRSMDTPGVIRVSNERTLTLESAKAFGIEKWVEKMLNFSDQLRRLRVDYFEYVSMKVIVLLTSDASGLKEAEHVRDSQEKVLQALQQYTISQYPSMPSKFGELLLRMPELHRVCQGCKEMLCPRQASDGEPAGFNLLMELLRGDH